MSAEDVRAVSLAAEIERDWRMVVTHLGHARSVDPGQGRAEAALVALSLDHAYQAFESLLVRLERSLGLPPRTGEEWHRRALADATLELPGVRPAVVPPAAERDWDEVRRFRHFLRHAYTVDLEDEKLRANVHHLERAVAATEASVRALYRALA